MKIIVAVCVYDRYQNVKKWINAWKQINGWSAELWIIHNYNGDDRIRDLVLSAYENNVLYLKRNNVGFDIGCVQDICKERLGGFPNDWDVLLWCADDTIPVAKDFIDQYMKTLAQPNCGIACMKISPHQVIHVRTSGWMITKKVAGALTFPADPVTTKQQCYLFEHRGGENTLVNQIRKMGLDVLQVAPDANAPLWDSGYWRRLDRGDLYYEVFGGAKQSDKVVFICTVYNQHPQIISSLLCQTHKNWELLLIHDGKSEDDRLKNLPKDPRIKFIETEERKEHYGHPIRQWALKNLDEMSDADFVVITNADNYYVPVFCEYMLRGFTKNPAAIATYCDKMVHSYKAWDTISVKIEKGFIDCGGVMIKRSVACEIGWRDTISHSADWIYFSDIIQRYNKKSFIPVKGCLLIHN